MASRLRDEVRKYPIVKAYKLTVDLGSHLHTNRRYHPIYAMSGCYPVGKWQKAVWYGFNSKPDDGHELIMCALGFHTIPTLDKAIAAAKFFCSRGDIALFECEVSAPEVSSDWIHVTEDGSGCSITKQLSRYQKLTKLIGVVKKGSYMFTEVNNNG